MFEVSGSPFRLLAVDRSEEEGSLLAQVSLPDPIKRGLGLWRFRTKEICDILGKRRHGVAPRGMLSILLLKGVLLKGLKILSPPRSSEIASVRLRDRFSDGATQSSLGNSHLFSDLSEERHIPLAHRNHRRFTQGAVLLGRGARCVLNLSRFNQWSLSICLHHSRERFNASFNVVRYRLSVEALEVAPFYRSGSGEPQQDLLATLINRKIRDQRLSKRTSRCRLKEAEELLMLLIAQRSEKCLNL